MNKYLLKILCKKLSILYSYQYTWNILQLKKFKYTKKEKKERLVYSLGIISQSILTTAITVSKEGQILDSATCSLAIYLPQRPMRKTIKYYRCPSSPWPCQTHCKAMPSSLVGTSHMRLLST